MNVTKEQMMSFLYRHVAIIPKDEEPIWDAIFSLIESSSPAPLPAEKAEAENERLRVALVHETESARSWIDESSAQRKRAEKAEGDLEEHKGQIRRLLTDNERQAAWITKAEAQLEKQAPLIRAVMRDRKSVV